MAVPTLDKAWQHNVNNPQGNTGVKDNDYADILLTIKRLLNGYSPNNVYLRWTNRWLVRASSNGIIANTGDNWDSTSDLVWSTINRSWIILRQAATDTEICLDCNSTNTHYMTLVWSHSAGFNVSTPVTNARPTATDEVVLINTNYWCSNQTLPLGVRVHAMVSLDGECTRVIVSWRNRTVLFWIFDLAKNPVAGWAIPSVAAMVYGTDSSPADQHTTWADTPRIRGRHGATDMSMYMSSESTWLTSGSKGIVRLAHIQAKNDFSQEWPLVPIGLTSETLGASGRHGQLHDIWFGSDLMSGKTYPDSLTNRFAQFGNIIVPWNGEGVITFG